MSNQLMTKQFAAEAAINANRIVKFGTTDDVMIQGAAATDALMGVYEGFGSVGAAIGDRIDVVMSGIAEVKLGGAVTRGGPVTSDATGQGVAAAPGAGVNNRVIGFALASGVNGDVIPVQIAQCSLQG